MRTLIALMATGLALAGCFSPDYQSGHLQCSVAGECPPGFRCVSERCYRYGDDPDMSIETPDLLESDLTTAPDLAPPPPILYPPAAVFISCGGGNATANGTQVNISLPGASAAGISVAPGGASLNFGFFSNDSVE